MSKKLDKSSGFGSYNHDEIIDNELKKHFKKYKINGLDIIKNSTIYIRRANLKDFYYTPSCLKKQ